MPSPRTRLASLAVQVPDILLPAASVDPSLWAVIACDQYSSEPEYWQRVQARVGAAASTYDLILPEAYLCAPDCEARIQAIQGRMREYLDRRLLVPAGAGMILVERSSPYEEKPRLGLMLAVDLEAYDYSEKSASLIRPTEGTVVQRIPPRMRIRRGAALELPHIMLLVDDPGRTLIEPLYARRERLQKLYDFELMLGSGRLRGWKLGAEAQLESIALALEGLASAAAANAPAPLFAVGDGNHSLAAAKAVWEEIKAQSPNSLDIQNHPARFALVEVVNIHDEGLPFHPIHRLVSGIEGRDFMTRLEAVADIQRLADSQAALDAVEADGERRKLAVLFGREAYLAVLKDLGPSLAAAQVQEFLDRLLAEKAGIELDYIHGAESLMALSRPEGKIGLLLPAIEKSSFFTTIAREGKFPRKTFSMGEASEKRFYMEARKIIF